MIEDNQKPVVYVSQDREGATVWVVEGCGEHLETKCGDKAQFFYDALMKRLGRDS